VRIQIRRSRRQLHRLHTSPVEQVQELGREQWVTIMDQVARALQVLLRPVHDQGLDLVVVEPDSPTESLGQNSVLFAKVFDELQLVLVIQTATAITTTGMDPGLSASVAQLPEPSRGSL
jgi:hypothetical protein